MEPEKDMKMKSDAVKKGVERAPHRSLIYALGCTREEMEKGVYLSWEAEGPIVVRARRVSGANAVVSGVFVDRP